MNGLVVGTSLSSTGVGSTVCVPLANCFAFITSVAELPSTKFYSKLRLRYTKLKDLINMVTKLYDDNTSNISNNNKKIDGKEAEELRTI